eukprot:scaffold23090_cov65-Phaeocystis_antarctica.AAC.5
MVKASQPAELIQATNERWLSISGEAEAVEAMVAAVMAQLLQSPATQQLKEIDYACLRQPPHAYAGLPPGWHPAAPPPPHHQHHQHHQHPRGPPQVLPPGYGGYPHPHHQHQHQQHPHHQHQHQHQHHQHPHHHPMHGGPPPMPPPLRAGTGPAGGPMGYKQFMGLLDDNVSPRGLEP